MQSFLGKITVVVGLSCALVAGILAFPSSVQSQGYPAYYNPYYNPTPTYYNPTPTYYHPTPTYYHPTPIYNPTPAPTPGKFWDVDSRNGGISSSQITTDMDRSGVLPRPLRVTPGQQFICAVASAHDSDHWKQGTQQGYALETQFHYTWTGPKTGTFVGYPTGTGKGPSGLGLSQPYQSTLLAGSQRAWPLPDYLHHRRHLNTKSKSR